MIKLGGDRSGDWSDVPYLTALDLSSGDIIKMLRGIVVYNTCMVYIYISTHLMDRTRMNLAIIKNSESPIPETPSVLIADDNAAMRALLRNAVTQWGYRVIEAVDGLDAWEKLQLADAPHILILDWLMPKLDGIELCERIRKQLNYYPYIIFLTQVTGATNIIHGIEAGADEFLLKPVNFSELRARIFAGSRIIEYQKIIEKQKQQLNDCMSAITSLQAVLQILIKE